LTDKNFEYAIIYTSLFTVNGTKSKKKMKKYTKNKLFTTYQFSITLAY